VYLARGWTLGLIQEKGFMDLKEQWFTKALNNGASIRVFDIAAPGQRWLGTRREYLRACRGVAAGIEDAETDTGIFTRGESAGRTWCIVDKSARVSKDALVCESAVFPGAEIEEGAIVVRSVVGREVRIARGEQVVDAVASQKGVTHG
jgi:NDP-sugar pyrophosphorylase family protein